MLIKLQTLINSEPALLTLLQEKTRREIAFSLAHDTRLMREALVPYQEERTRLITKYGEKQENGEIAILQGSPNLSKFQKEINEYVGENELELDLKKIKPELLPNEISGAVLLDLSWLIEEPEEKEPRKRHTGAK
jgi:hypothetical protein